MFRKILLNAVLLLVVPIAHAANYTDLWVTQGEAGWGLNLVQQGETIFGTWFVYGADGKPLWLVMSNGVQTSTGSQVPVVFQGELYETTGPAWKGQFDPDRVVLTKVGLATLRFDTSYSGSLTYSVNSDSITKIIQRLGFGPTPLQGNYRFALFGQSRSSCLSISNNTRSATGMFRLSMNPADELGNNLVVVSRPGGGYQITEQSYIGVKCIATVPSIENRGRLISMSGLYSCSDGRSGTFIWSDVEVSFDRVYGSGSAAARLTGSFTSRDTAGETCVASGTFTAVGQTCPSFTMSGPCSGDYPM